MKYIDVHTHMLPTEETDLREVCVNWIIGKEKPDYKCLSAGIHPWFIEGTGKEQLALLEEVAQNPEVRMIGEAGLDKSAAAPWIIQMELLRAQIELAESFQKPLILHCVKAWQELIALHKEYRPKSVWIVHGFRGKKELAAQLIRQGFYLSFGERFSAESLCVAWSNRLLVETDESSLPLPAIYRQIALSLQVPIEQFSFQVEQNVRNVRNKNLN